MPPPCNVQNRTVFCRDNLEVLRQINSECIDLIYLDPPFNKKKIFTAPIGTTAEGAEFKDIFGKEDVKDAEISKIRIKYPQIHSLIETAKAMKSQYNWCYLTYMAIRLIECHRVLKPRGSLYLHCDSTMSHYLKLLLDCIFSEKNFRDEIIWNVKSVSGFKSQKRGFIRQHDAILYYSKTSDFTFNKIYLPYGEEYVKKMFKHKDQRGLRYRLRGNKKYFENERGIPLGTNWTDIYSLQTTTRSSEITGYPTQKPLKLLERIVESSSNENDIVLDPFCGCATTCVAAEKLNRQWIGIDISEKAFDLVRQRLKTEVKQDLIDWNKKIILRKDLPQRTDLGRIKPYRDPDNIDQLFAEQEAKCNGCRLTGQITAMMEKRHFHVDHVTPKSKGGTDQIDNLQLLCGNCNSSKGNKSMEEWTAFKKKQLKNVKIY